MERETRGCVRPDEAVKDLLHDTIQGVFDVYLEMNLLRDLLRSHTIDCDGKLENVHAQGLFQVLSRLTDQIHTFQKQINEVV